MSSENTDHFLLTCLQGFFHRLSVSVAKTLTIMSNRCGGAKYTRLFSVFKTFSLSNQGDFPPFLFLRVFTVNES